MHRILDALGLVPYMPGDRFRAYNRRVFFRRMLTGAAIVLVVVLSKWAWAEEHRFDCPNGCKVIVVMPGDTPPPPPPPPPAPPPPPSGCNPLSVPLGENTWGVRNVSIAEGQPLSFCATLPRPARVVLFDISKQCLGANFEMKVTPTTRFYSDGKTVMPVYRTTRSAQYGAMNVSPGFIPAQTFRVDVTGGPVGSNCSGNVSKFHLTWSWVE